MIAVETEKAERVYRLGEFHRFEAQAEPISLFSSRRRNFRTGSRCRHADRLG